jgi:hypothetical protein
MSLPCTPPVNLDNDLSIDQNIENIDTCSCQLNSFFNSLVQLLNTLNINGSINLDINAFINCTRPQWNNPTFKGISDADANRFRNGAIAYYNGPAGAGLTEEQKAQKINQIIAYANQSFKILQWLGSGNKKGQSSDIVRSRIIPFTIKCSSATQSYDTVGSNECNDECLVNIPIILVTRSLKAHCTMITLIQKLKSGSAVSCCLDLPPGYSINKDSDNTSNEIIATVESGWLGYSSHAVSCIGFECEGDYVIFTFKDSFEYGTTVKRPGIFKIRVNKNMKYVPFGVGNRLALESDTVFTNCIFPPKEKTKIEEAINETLAKCCVTPTPTPTPSLTVTPSDIFGPPEPTQTASSLPPPTPSLSY